MKKILSVLLAALFVLSFAACKSDNEEKGIEYSSEYIEINEGGSGDSNEFIEETEDEAGDPDEDTNTSNETYSEEQITEEAV